MEGKVVFQNDEILIRYPLNDDVGIMLDYFNTLSNEKTFIQFQGEQYTFVEEKDYLDGILKKISEKKCVLLLAFIKDRLVAISQIVLNEHVESHVGVFGISVTKEYRGRGIGKVLMETVLQESAKNILGLRIVTIEVYEKNLVAQRLYKKFGFVEYGKLPDGVFRRGEYEDEILMYKKV